MLSCCETNHDGKIDYITFTDRFHEPSKEIGFNLAVLLTNLSEHMPNEPRYNVVSTLRSVHMISNKIVYFTTVKEKKLYQYESV